MNILSILLWIQFLWIPGSGKLIVTKTGAGMLSVQITGFRNNKGNAVLSLYNQKDGFPGKESKALRVLKVNIAHQSATANFENLAPGTYAIAVFHDENGNGKIDTNIFGIPKEGVGASNNAKGHMGPPSYTDAKFEFDGNTKNLSISIVYL